MLGKIIFFILFTGTIHIFAGIDSTGFKITHALEYYTIRAKLRRKKYAKLSIGAVIKIVWRTYIIQVNTNAEQRIDFQMYYIQSS